MLNFKVQNNSVIASLEGTRRINRVISGMVKEEIIAFLESKGKQVILDLKGISFIDSSGFEALKAISELAQAGDRIFALANVSDEVMELVQLVELDQTLTIWKN